jgi:hypothetical protein
VANNLISGQVRQNPSLAPFLLPVLFAYFAFVLMSWLAYPLFNLLLRLDRFGRLALSPDQRWGANVLVLCIIATLACLTAALVLDSGTLLKATIMCALLSLPASAIYVCEAGWPRHAMLGITLALAAAVAFVVSLAVLPSAWVPPPLVLGWAAVMGLLPYALLASQFAAMALSRVTPRK